MPAKGFSDIGGLFPLPDGLPLAGFSAIAAPAPPAPELPDTPKQARAATPASPTSAEGHRARMRHRLLTAGPAALGDHELLEMTLFLALPRRDTKPIARALLARFGSYADAIAAPAAELRMIDGLGDAGLAALKTIQAAALRLAQVAVVGKPILSNWQALCDYLNTTLARLRVEQFRVLYLDARNHLLGDEVQGVGTVNHTPVYPREVLKRALELGATAMILVHNHPSGDATPSHDDIEMTRAIRRAGEPLRVALHDHLIVAGGTITSLRRMKVI